MTSPGTPKPPNWKIVGAVLLIPVVGAVVYTQQMSSHASPPASTATDATVDVVAPAGVCWTANVAQATQQGCADKSFPVHDESGIFVASVQKASADGIEVQISITINGEVRKQNSTSADYGVASVDVAP